MKDIITLIISLVALALSIPSFILVLYQLITKRFSLHMTCEPFENENEYFANFMFINFSLEAYSILRIDYFIGTNMQMIDISDLLQSVDTTLVKPSELLIIETIPLNFSQELILNSANLATYVKVYTSKRKDPYIIKFNYGKDASTTILTPKEKKKYKIQI